MRAGFVGAGGVVVLRWRVRIRATAGAAIGDEVFFVVLLLLAMGCLRAALGGDLGESGIFTGETSLDAGQGLPAPDGGVDVKRVKFNGAGMTSGALGGDQDRARAAEGIEHGLAALGAVANDVRDHCNRFHGGVGGEISVPALAEGIGARVVPDVGAITPVAAEFDIVDVRRIAMPEDEAELMLGAVKASHAGVVLVPAAERDLLQGDAPASRHQLVSVAPVHKGVDQSTEIADIGRAAEKTLEKLGELAFRHLTGGHDEFAVLDAAKAADVAGDRYIVRRISDHGTRMRPRHHGVIARRFQGIAAVKKVGAELPEIPNTGHGVRLERRKLIVPRGRFRRILLNDEVDLRRAEAGHLGGEIQIGQAEIDHLEPKHLAVPFGELGQAVVTNDIGALLRLSHALDPQRRHLGHAERLGSLKPAVTGEDLALSVDQYGIGKAELADRRGEQGDLLGRMLTRIARIDLQSLNPQPDDFAGEDLRNVGLDLAAVALRRSSFAVARAFTYRSKRLLKIGRRHVCPPLGKCIRYRADIGAVVNGP